MAKGRFGLTAGQQQTLLIALAWVALSASLGLPSLRSGSPAAPRAPAVRAAPAPGAQAPREDVPVPSRGPVVIDRPEVPGLSLPPVSKPPADGEPAPSPGSPGLIDGIIPVPEQLTPITLRIGDVIVGGCAMHNSNLTAAILVLSAFGDPPDDLIQLFYLPGDRCFVLGSSGTRTVCTYDTALDSEALPDQFGLLPIAGPPPLVGGTIAILSGLEETAALFGVPPPEIAAALGEALGCETVIV